MSAGAADRTPAAADTAPRLVVFSDDFGRHPSSAQHIARCLVPRWRVDWVNTIGTRRPSLSARDLARAAGKLRDWFGSGDAPASAATPPPTGLTVHSPIHWPGFGLQLERRANAALLARGLREVLDPANPPVAVIATAPIPADLAAARPDLVWLYYCVDDLSQWPGLDGPALARLEAEFLRHVRGVIAVSEHLVARMAEFGQDAELLTHGIELQRWAGVVRRTPPVAPVRPQALFWGVADRRLDTELCLALAERCDLSFVGPADDPDPRVVQHPAITLEGPLPYAELSGRAALADVLVMPYADLPVTRAMQPLKLKEYLATGLPVVCSDLPANREWKDALDLTFDPARFAQLAEERARAPLPVEQAAARKALANETWDAKAKLFEDFVARHTGVRP
ncbi:MAG: hypothetical protein H6831_13225 [Planctomycetes bacterium]|nr:hypothetical protein [Planctomycetota bacterium]MCB9905361.1 hypothetical protein [Planctomycetota bacterium]